MNARALIMAIVLAAFALPAASAVIYHDYYGAYGGEQFLTWKEAFEAYQDPYVLEMTPKQRFAGCYIAGPGQTLLEDLDCDKVPAPYDNCLLAPNPLQEDQNSNGIGDACDVYLESVTLEPQESIDGRSATVTLRVTNNRPVEVRNAQALLQTTFGAQTQSEFLTLAPGERKDIELYFKVAPCTAPGTYPLSVTFALPAAPGVEEQFPASLPLRIAASGRCGANGTSESPASVITILQLQDVDAQEGAAYPFTIENQAMFDQRYVLSVEGLEDWGTYSIEPLSLITVRAGARREGTLTIFASAQAHGTKEFTLVIKSRTETQRVRLLARIPEERHVSAPLPFWWFIAGGSAALLLILLFVLRKPWARRDTAQSA